MRTTLLILFSFLSYNLFSQQDSVLKKFKYRVDHYQAISFSIGGGGNFASTGYIPGTQEQKSAGGNASGYYTFYKSSNKILLSFAAGMYINYGAGKTDNSTNSNKYRAGYAVPYLSASNKWFGKKIFTELSVDISAGLQGNKQYFSGSVPENETSDNQNYYSVAVTAGIGKGRLENVMDMQNALWLYKALQDEDKLSRQLSADELNDLGRTITKANNTRILDSRKRTQFMLETTDSFFKNKNLVTDCDIRYFSILNDILFYAINNQRFSGTEIYVRLTPELRQQFNETTNKTPSYKTENTNNIKSVRIAAGINKHVPANLKHQNNYGGSFFASYTYWDEVYKSFDSGSQTSRDDFNSALKQAGIAVYFQHAIYPNTRTIVNFDLKGETGFENIEGDQTFYGTAGLDGSLNYFVSYRTRLTAALGVSYQRNIYEKLYYLTLLPERFLLNGNIGLQVSL